MTSTFRFLVRMLGIALATLFCACADVQEVGGEAQQTATNPGGVKTAVSALPSIEPADLATRLQATESAPLVLDVRTKAEFDAGHIPGALNIPEDELVDRIAEVDGTNGVAVHCVVGPRARKAEATLVSAGIENVLHLEGGYLAWKSAGLETTE